MEGSQPPGTRSPCSWDEPRQLSLDSNGSVPRAGAELWVLLWLRCIVSKGPAAPNTLPTWHPCKHP